jgi:hypothetical protein
LFVHCLCLRILRLRISSTHAVRRPARSGVTGWRSWAKEGQVFLWAGGAFPSVNVAPTSGQRRADGRRHLRGHGWGWCPGALYGPVSDGMTWKGEVVILVSARMFGGKSAWRAHSGPNVVAVTSLSYVASPAGSPCHARPSQAGCSKPEHPGPLCLLRQTRRATWRALPPSSSR